MVTGSSVIMSATNPESSAGVDQFKDSSLGKDAFFDLLITQLRNQDPLKPMEDKEFIAQMAQFSSLEQMQNMNENMEQFLQMQTLTRGAALIGKQVEVVEDQGEGQNIISGEVTRIGYEDKEIFAYLDGGENKVNVNDISSIY